MNYGANPGNSAASDPTESPTTSAAPYVHTHGTSDMNTARKLGPHTQTNRGRALVWGSELTSKAATLNGDRQAFVYVGLDPVVARARVWFTRVLDRSSAQAVVRGGARCA
jgi:hypothetical protein